jgi:hypothetical protein
MAPTTTITTPLPADLSPASLIKLLHNHETYLRTTCPQMISHELIDTASSASSDSGSDSELDTSTYRVTDKKPLGQTTYTLTLTNTEDGIDTLVNAKPPVGSLKIAGKWRVAEGKLVEEVEIDANMVLRKMVKGNLEKAHADHHVELMKLAMDA